MWFHMSEVVKPITIIPSLYVYSSIVNMNGCHRFNRVQSRKVLSGGREREFGQVQHLFFTKLQGKHEIFLPKSMRVGHILS